MTRLRSITTGLCAALCFVSWAACGGTTGSSRLDAELNAQRSARLLRESVLVVSSVGDVYWPAPSPDGRELLYVSGESGNLDIWSRDLVTLTGRRLTDHSADDSDPAFSPDGDKIAFVSRRDDAKGDIWVMNRDGSDPTRITGVVTADRSPAFAADSKSLFITLRPAADLVENIYRVDLESRTPVPVTTDGGFDAAIDASGKFMAFSKPIEQDGVLTTRVAVMRLSDKKIMMPTDGRRPEAFPRFGKDKAGVTWLYYGRYVEDDSRDGKIDTFDVPSLYRVSIDDAAFTEKDLRYSEPLTSGAGSENLAACTGDTLFFVSQGSSHLEIQALPLDGLLSSGVTTTDVMSLADSDLSPRLRRYLLRVVMGRGGAEAIKARYELARDFAGEDKLADAQTAFDRLIEIAGPQTPLGKLGRLEKVRNQVFLDARDDKADRLKAEQEIKAIVGDSSSEIVQARASVVLAEVNELLGRYGPALDDLRSVPRTGDNFDEDATRSDSLEARVGAIALPIEEQARRLLRVMTNHPSQVRERRIALERLVALLPKTKPERIALLTTLIAETKVPATKSPLVRRYAETLLEQGDAATAVDTLRQSLAKERYTITDQARMLLALAGAEEAAGQLDEAIGSLEKVMNNTDMPRGQRERAHDELLRIAATKARRDEQRGDVASAYAAYRKLAANNPQEASAVRKVVLLGNQLGKGAELESEMAQRAKANPFDKVATYAYALAASFVGDYGITKKQLEKSLAVDSRFAWARMLQGWLKEREGHRTAYNDAADEYDKAFLQFDREHDAEGAADAALNMGNALLGAGEAEQAFDRYLRREQAHLPFQSRAQELIFRERFGQSALRSEEYDVALTELRDAVRLATSEGDERRLGRLRGLSALAYLLLDMPEQARTQLLLARDDYAARGDLNRVAVLDRTLALLYLSNGDDAEAARSLERAESLHKQGFGPHGTTFGLLAPLIPITANDTSRAPYGFGPKDEEEIVDTLFARLWRRLVDVRRAETFLEMRLKMIDNIASDSALTNVVVRERVQAEAELMSLKQRRGDRAGVEILAGRAFAHLLERPAEDMGQIVFGWATPVLALLENHGAPLSAVLVAAINDFATRATAVDATADATAPVMATRAKALLAKNQQARLPAAPAAASLEAAWAALDQIVLPELSATAGTATTTAASAAPSSMAASGAAPSAGSVAATGVSTTPDERGLDRRRAAETVRDALNAAEHAWLNGNEKAGGDAVVRARTLIDQFGLYEANWQLAYLRYRLGPADERTQALNDAATALRTADAAARLLYADRPRPRLRGELLKALLAKAVASRDVAAIAQRLEQRDTVPWFTLPTALPQAGAPEVDQMRAKLADWRRVTLRTFDDERAKPGTKAAQRVRDQIATLNKLLDALPQPLAMLITGKLDLAALQQQLGDRELVRVSLQGFGPTLEIARARITLGTEAASQPAGQPASSPIAMQPPKGPAMVSSSMPAAAASDLRAAKTPASLPASQPPDLFVYGTPDTDSIQARVPSLSTLVLQLAARTVSERPALDLGVGPRVIVDSDRPTLASELQGNPRRAARIQAEALDDVGLGAFRLKLAGPEGKERDDLYDTGLYAADLPRGFAAANVVVIDGVARPAQQKSDIVRGLALAGTPSVLFCEAATPELGQAAAKQAWQHLLADEPATGCELWGTSPGDAEAKRRIAENRLKQQDGAAVKAANDKRLADAVKLNEECLDLARYLGLPDDVLKYRARLAQQAALLKRFDDAVAYQRDVIIAYQGKRIAATDPAAVKSGLNNEAAANELLGRILSFAGRYDDAAIVFSDAIARYADLKSDVDIGRMLQQQGTAYRAAVRYREAIEAFQSAAERFVAAKKPALESDALRFAAVIADSNFSNFELGLQLFERGLKAAEQAQDAAAILRSRIDVARTYRKLSRFDEATKAIRAVLRDLERVTPDAPTLASRTEAQLELARVYWLRANYERALSEEQSAGALADAARSRAKNRDEERRADRLRIQVRSLEGLILMSQGKLIASTNRFRRALQLARSRTERSEEAAQLNNMGAVLRERGLNNEALNVFESALAIDSELKDNDGLAFDYRNVAVTQLRAGRLDVSRAELRRAQDMNQKVGNRYNDVQTRLSLAELALLSNDAAAAREGFASAVKDATQLNFSDVVWRATFGLGLASSGVDRIKALETAFDLWTDLGVHLDESDAALSKMNPLSAAHLVETLLTQYLQAGSLDRLEHALEVLQLKELREEIPASVWQSRIGLDADDLANKRKVQGAADKDELLRPILLLEPSRTLANVTGNVVVLRAIGAGVVWMRKANGKIEAGMLPIALSTLEREATAWLSAMRVMAQPPALSFVEGLRPVLEAAALDQLTVIGDTLMSRLPWAALPLAKGYLVERAPVTMALSISHLDSVPAMRSDALTVAMPTPSDDLPFGELEAKESLALWKELGRAPQAVKLAQVTATRMGTLHLALHGEAGAGFERAVLRQGETTLSAASVMGTRHPLESVLLSACQSEASAPLGGEFVVAFRLSGAQRVIAPIGRVYDDLAALFAKHVVRMLAANGTAADFAKLQIERLQRGDPAVTWASYQYWGR